jgi:hypothetical protein
MHATIVPSRIAQVLLWISLSACPVHHDFGESFEVLSIQVSFPHVGLIQIPFTGIYVL